MGGYLNDVENVGKERERQNKARLISNQRIMRRKILMEEYKKSGMSLDDAMYAAEVQESDEHYRRVERAAMERDAMERAAMERATMERAGGRRKTKSRKTKRRKSKARRKNL